MANDKDPVDKTLMASSSDANPSEYSVDSNLITLMVDSGASDHYFDDATIRDLTHRVVESKNITFIETLPHMFPLVSKLSPLQDLALPSWDLDDVHSGQRTYLSYGDLLWNIRNYTGVLDFTAKISADHENVSSVSADPQVPQLVDEIRDLTWRDLLAPAAPFPGVASPAEPLSGAVRELLSGGAPPRKGGGASPGTGGLLPAPVSATARRGTVMCNNKIVRSNVVTQRAAAEPTGAVTP